LNIRAGTSDDLPFVELMLFEAFFWDETAERPALSAFRGNAEFTKLLDGWGRVGDCAVIAEGSGGSVGAACSGSGRLSVIRTVSSTQTLRN
jgi:hypothetical protein